ncbi:SRPBCC domain-containing protein [Planotetraspora sp. A-T 1434]|uniref:SRPBCC family protein n=1 Tax=Planotetraspora sp. A-T 1434 TaxID=2979219 RepID=UPI0021C1B32C|nr:SRPBCC domain-containing protein [Planotetraspora sp. A-T 1434]MCT9933388.1 SRPBCC domain-containing protein [Planotetraspora sp. A-T 1434]
MTDERTGLHLDEFLPHPPHKVWRALTEPELVSRWLMTDDFRLEVGHRYTMTAQPMPSTGFSGVATCRVLEFEPEKLLTTSWKDEAGNGIEFTVSWRLEPEGRGTRLFLDHEGFDPGDPLHQRARSIMEGGWRAGVFPAIAAVLDGM